MSLIDEIAAENLQEAFQKLQSGPWNTGETGAKGASITEPLIPTAASQSDNLHRYTDKYIQTKKIGQTVESYEFNERFLPPELYKCVGITKSSSVKAETTQKTVDLRVMKDIAEDDEEDKDEEAKDEEEDEDEFEELDDDDYNAEKYFDDGEEFGEIDEGDDEAAY